MDCDNNENGAKEPWDWHRNDCNLEKNSNFGQDISEDLWNDMPQNDEYISYMFEDEEATPVKACGDLGYGVNDSVLDDVQKEVEELRETSSQVKRRRMLQFNIQDSDHSLSSEEMSLAYLKSDEKVDSLMDPFPEVSEWVPGSSEYALGDLPASSYEDLESTEGWLAECLNDAAMQFSPDELNFSGAEDIQIDIAELSDITAPSEQNVVQQQQQQVTQTPKRIVFKGRKSFIRTPTKLASSVAYPFAFIKPSGTHGDITLKEINQRIRTPPPSKTKQSSEDPSAYPKSAFSGKPVVNKTKIRTEGGKGSITIMRTKG
ncbi:protein XRI1-like isoform X1 [Arachis stenosperma]|uniref:protein XRI1-like isoform X1 n=1 Tax=Arachis stenosperma TaxID=217475 RepID=UPI0025AC2C77|nr:protein XRI1-like isoform X1 [Arachis stenosperma]